jgi:hypothetical protein
MQESLRQALVGADIPAAVADALARVTFQAGVLGVGNAAGGAGAGAAAMNVDANNRQLHPTERVLAAQLAKKSKGKYTQKQIEDAMRNTGNSKYGEDVTAGMLINGTQDIYDKGAAFNVPVNGVSAQALPNNGRVDPDLADFISANTGGANSAYSWDASQTGRVTPSATSSTGSYSTPTQRYQTVSVNGKSFSLPVANCPAAGCANGDNIARFGASAADQATLDAYDAALNQQNAKAGVKGALVVGTTVLLPVTAVGLAGSGAIVGGGSSAADQAIDGKPVDMVTVAIDTVVGAATGLATYGVVKIAGALGTAAKGDTGASGTAISPGKLIGSTEGLTTAEQSFIGEMVSGGRTVEVIPATSAGRTADFFIDGTKVELKTMTNVVNQTSDGLSKSLSSTIMNARGQSANIIIDARGQAGMTPEIAERGIQRAFGNDSRTGSKIQTVTVITSQGTVYIRRKP